MSRWNAPAVRQTRRYLRVDPDNRLVADALEGDWNDKLRALSQAQQDYDHQRQADEDMLSTEERQRIAALATPAETVDAIDRLLVDHNDAEIAAKLTERGFRSGKGDPFQPDVVAHIRRQYGLESRYQRLRARGLMGKRVGVTFFSAPAATRARLDDR